MKPDPKKILEHVWLPRGQTKIVEVLADVYPRRIHMNMLINLVYADDPDGGPVNAAQTIRTQIHKIRQTLPQYGWTIPRNGSGRDAAHRCFYVLAPVSADCMK